MHISINKKESKIKNKSGFSALRTRAGFTLVETLVAIAILMIAIAGPLTVAEKGLSASIYARNQLMASYLAQEGIEYVRNIVDSNQSVIHESSNTNNIDWLHNSAGAAVTELSQCTSSDPCTVDTINKDIENCAADCYTLSLGPAGYAQATGAVSNQGTVFTRSFYLQGFNLDGTGTSCTSSACAAANVVVNISWPGGLTSAGGVTLEDTLYNTPIQ